MAMGLGLPFFWARAMSRAELKNARSSGDSLPLTTRFTQAANVSLRCSAADTLWALTA